MSSDGQLAEAALAYTDQHRDAFLKELKELLRIPSISTIPDHKKDVKRAAKFIASQLEDIGLENVHLIKIEGQHPLVYGEWLKADGKPTVLLYGHYDVQPVDPVSEWRSDPFEPVVRNDNIYARGAVDDKGQMFALVKSLEALMRGGNGALPVNVKVLIEGEEESGGEAIEQYVKEHPAELACDVALIADSGMPAPDVPALDYALRGIVYTEIHARGAKQDLHSGEFGGVAPNPIHALAQILVGLKGADGHINIPGLYEKVPPISKEEMKLWDRNPVDVAASLKREMGIDVLPGEQEYDPRVRQTARPTLEVHGIAGGFTGEGAKTVIPAEATAKVSMRLPYPLTPEEVFPMLESRVKELCPPGITVTVKLIHGGHAVYVPVDNIFVRAAESAIEQEWGKPPVFQRSGGSIPIGALFDSVLHVPVIFMGTGLPDDNMHAPNEKYHVPNFYRLIRQATRFMAIAGTDPAILARPPHAANGKKATKKTTKAKAQS